LTATTVNGSGNGARSGAQILVLLATPLNRQILEALSDRPKRQTELRHEAGSPAQTTLRSQLKRLTEIGAIDKHRRNRFPGVLEYELTPAGRDLLFVVDVLDNWLDRAPEGSLSLGNNAARAAIKALVDGWSTSMLRALAATPLSLTELDGVINSLSYPSLERRLAAMRLAGQVEACTGPGRGTPSKVTQWLRQGVAPLAAAGRWERRHLPNSTAAIRSLDIEAAFLLAMPLLQLPEELSGVCRLATEIPTSNGRRLAGVTAEVKEGRIASCATQLQASTDAWALGSPVAWLDAVIDHDRDRLELGGDGQLLRATLDGLHRALFGSGARKKI
jgi:DNA-binding HxlR family transcriptional regulator